MSTLQSGEVFAGYTIERLLGAGGMGEVYVARHPRLPRRDALKILAPGLAADDQFRRRFEREADAVAGFSHPNIVKVYDRGEAEGRLWITLELIDGADLTAVTARGPVPFADTVRWLGEIASALDEAAGYGLVHRDVKPANTLVDRRGRALLTDFGIAHLVSEAAELTGTGMTVGTVTYASPEQLQGMAVDARADQYALACTAFVLLAGSAPYGGVNAGAILVQHVTSPIPSAVQRNPGLPPAVDAVFFRALAKNPADRFPTSVAFVDALAGALGGAIHAAPSPTVPSAPGAPHSATAAVPTAVVPPVVVPPAPAVPVPSAPVPGRRPRRSGRVIAGVAAAVVVVIALVVALVVTLGRGDDGGSARNGRLLVTPDMASLKSAPTDPKWVFTGAGPRSVQAVGGNERYVMMTSDGGSGGATVYVVDARSGKGVHQWTVPGSGVVLSSCHGLEPGDAVVCATDVVEGAYVIIDLATGKLHPLSVGRGGRVIVSGDTVVTIAKSGAITAYGADGAAKWSAQSSASAWRLPVEGSPVIALSDGRTFTVREIATGRTVFSEDAASGLDPERESSWGAFRTGFVINAGNRVELYNAAGTKTATVEGGWSPVGYDEGASATGLPVLTDEATKQTATFDPATGKPVATVTWPEPAGLITGAVGTKVVVTFPSAGTAASNGDGYPFGWFDAYDGKTGTFDAQFGTALGTDGERLLVSLDSDSFAAFGIDSSTPLWRQTLDDRYTLLAVGGKLYDRNRRLL
ncbi:serine/threonine-protein kinase [Gordonia sp. PP30]|uniref:protein kinase domain-containing protein n=1 Tax=Gordonia sp. PP30 TaxID=2935861 RepID=UPI001FFF8EC5|nr:protein kinase [Gordonia sp. PP30]UQE76329.1 serine/threonine-protein kinase [Gordonia sp. PP30]